MESNKKAVKPGMESSEDTGVEPTSRRLTEDDVTVAPSEIKVPTCLQLIMHWRKCSMFKTQFHYYYIHGDFNQCLQQRQDMKTCLNMKFQNNDKQKAAFADVVKRWNEHETFVNNPSKNVWELREDPGKDWKEL